MHTPIAWISAAHIKVSNMLRLFISDRKKIFRVGQADLSGFDAAAGKCKDRDARQARSAWARISRFRTWTPLGQFTEQELQWRHWICRTCSGSSRNFSRAMANWP